MPYFIKKSKAILLVLVMMSMQSLAQFVPDSFRELSAPLSNPDQAPDNAFVFDKENWTEDIKARTLYSTLWNTPDGRVVGEYSHKPIHYITDKGFMERIDPSWTEYEEGWIASHQPFPIKVDRRGVISTNSYWRPVQFGINGIFNGKKIKATPEVSGENQLVMKNVYPGVDKELQGMENAVKSQFRIHSPIDAEGEYLIISEEVKVHTGSTIVRDEAHGKMEDGKWKGSLLVKSANGNDIAFLQGTLCYDAEKNIELSGYTWEKIDETTWRVTTWIKNAWLNDAERNYPVVIDPLIIGPLTMYAEQFMPSCTIPEYFVDSILVTVPGQITVTGLYVTASFYADPFTTAIMEDGAMYFSSSCNQTNTFEVAPPNGELPGTAFLEAFDMQNPLMCCYPQSCSETSFYLKMHLGRYIPEGDCNFTYIYYTPVTLWPFTAYIEGHTVESYGPQWTVPGAEICSNQCEFTGTIRAKYGVPPYTFTHDWMVESISIGAPEGCDPGIEIEQLPLSWPGCPVFCPEFDEMDVPPPTITDACGNTVAGLPMENLNFKPSPDVLFPEPVVICSNLPETLPLSSCEPGSTYFWSGNGNSGTGNASLFAINESDQPIIVNFDVHSSHDGCESDTISIPVTVMPSPTADFVISPESPMLGSPTEFNDQSTTPVGEIDQWIWMINGGSQQTGSVVYYAFETLDTYEACLVAITEAGCPDTLCKDLQVITANVFAPNIFTPNSDGLNDVLEFQYLEFFPDNELQIWNRWGNLIYSREGYTNNWNGGDFAEGTYYYLLKINGADSVDGYFQLLR